MEKLNFMTKMYEVCSTDNIRPLLMCVHFRDGFMYASNGMIAVKQSLGYHSIVNPEFLEGRSLHRDSYKQIMGFEIAEAMEDGISCRDATDGRVVFFEYFDRDGKEIPDFDKVMVKGGLSSISFIGIQPDQLYRLSKALYAPVANYRMQFQGIDKAILIDVIGVPDQEAIIMPLILNDTLF